MTETEDLRTPTAAVLLIGNELLSGRTQDINLSHIASKLHEKGIRVLEARVIPDIAETIVDSVNTLRKAHSYVFTTGGIGPTLDDITADCIAQAFGVDLPTNPQAESILLNYFSERGIEVNEDRMRMARIPAGATLIENSVSAAPGFRLENVYVFAGVPKIMQAMFARVLPTLATGAEILSVSIDCDLTEGSIAGELRALQARFPTLEIGSYPGNEVGSGRLSLVIKSTEPDLLHEARAVLADAISRCGGRELNT